MWGCVLCPLPANKKPLKPVWALRKLGTWHKAASPLTFLRPVNTWNCRCGSGPDLFTYNWDKVNMRRQERALRSIAPMPKYQPNLDPWYWLETSDMTYAARDWDNTGQASGGLVFPSPGLWSWSILLFIPSGKWHWTMRPKGHIIITSQSPQT